MTVSKSNVNANVTVKRFFKKGKVACCDYLSKNCKLRFSEQ